MAANRLDHTNHFVAGDEGVGGDGPVVVLQACCRHNHKIASTVAASLRVRGSAADAGVVLTLLSVCWAGVLSTHPHVQVCVAQAVVGDLW